MTAVIEFIYYNGHQAQHLRNVPVMYPSIIWVQMGEKKLQWQNEWLTINNKNWLLTSENSLLTFINQPSAIKFASVQMCFLIRPSDALIARSQHQYIKTHRPDFIFDHSGEYLFHQLLNMPKSLPCNVKTCLVTALFEYLANNGLLHQLFSEQSQSWRNKLTTYFSQHPENEHKIEHVCHHFGLSKSTLIRRLRNESTQFREVLAELRMSYALTLLQEKHYTQLDLAQLCGYQSEVRFAQRFQKQFGISLKKYQQTLKLT